VRVAALYDIHGNVPALDAVLDEVDPDATIVVGGDAIMGPWPRETLERLRALGPRVRWVRGNADRELVSPSPPTEVGPPQEVVQWVRVQLTTDDIAFLDSLPLTQALDVDGVGRVLFCHATPRDDNEVLTRISPDEGWLAATAQAREPTIVCGHTHVQFDRAVDGIRVVNAGSVGAPYEAEPGAYWALLGADVELRRTAYDVEAAAAAIRATGYPRTAEVETYLAADPERPHRLSALIEGLP
jgi:predicted phosphodiesterase